MRELGRWLKDAGIGWYEDKAMRLSSSLAYYTLLSLTPIVLVAISIAELLLGEEAARRRIAEQVTKMRGVEAAALIDAIIVHAGKPQDTWWGALAGLVVSVLGASAACTELQAALNAIWHVAPKPGRRIIGVLRGRLVAFAMVLGAALLLLVSLLLGVAFASFEALLSTLPGGARLWQVFTFSFTVAVAMALFAVCFKVVPDVKIRFCDVWSGAAVSALLFALGELALGFYITSPLLSSPAGAAGSVIVLVVWVYYGAQILFFGAELTRAQVVRRGTVIRPNAHALSTLPATVPRR